MNREPLIWGIGVGPGDPELITLKAVRLLGRADVIAYPAPLEGESLARRIAAPHLPEGAEHYPIRMSMDPSRYPQNDVYDVAERVIGGHAEKGRTVAVLCEGDPFFYGSFMYLFERLSKRWPVGVIPGVSSLTACAARLRMPLAARNDVLMVIPATLDTQSIVSRLAQCDMAAIIKVGRHLSRVREALELAGLTKSARLVERATFPAERVWEPGTLPDEAPYFSMILAHRRGGAMR